MYRHIGDAVPPLVAYQLAHVCKWILTGNRPAIEDAILPNTHLVPSDIKEFAEQKMLQFVSG